MARFSAALLVAALCAGFVVAAPAPAPSSSTVDTATVHVADVSFDRTTTATKRDVTSAWSRYIGTTDGSSLTGACGVPYNDQSHGACVSSPGYCGNQIYAYIGNGSNSTLQTTATVVDVCEDLSEDGVNFTLDSFQELGGTIKGGVIKNVNWKFL